MVLSSTGLEIPLINPGRLAPGWFHCAGLGLGDLGFLPTVLGSIELFRDPCARHEDLP
jgi:hypothetical protein